MNQHHRPTRSEQREAARAKARELRLQHKKNERRKSLFIKLGVALGIVAVFAGIAGIVIGGTNANNATNIVEPENLTAERGIKIGANGVAFTSTSTPVATPSAGVTAAPIKPVEIVTYVDYQCPACKTFEDANFEQIKGWLDSGLATLEIRPLTFLDRVSANEYSSRTAGLIFAVATYDPNSFLRVTKYLYDNQPEELTAGPNNEELLNAVQSLGVKNFAQIKKAVDGNGMKKWALKNTDAAPQEVLAAGTPYILVNGEKYEGYINNAAQFSQFVATKIGN